MHSAPAAAHAAACRHARRPPLALHSQAARRTAHRAAATVRGPRRRIFSSLQYSNTNGYIEPGIPDEADVLRAGWPVQCPNNAAGDLRGFAAAGAERGGDGQRAVPRGAGAGDAADRVPVPRRRRIRQVRRHRHRAPADAVPLASPLHQLATGTLSFPRS